MSEALTPVSVSDVMQLGTVFAKSGYFQDARDAAQAVVKILAGAELGFGPVASMTGMYIVKGKVSMSANLIAAAVKRGKYNYRVVELTEKACKIDFYEGKEKIGESAFSMEDAKVAGLVNENYKKFARNMLFARAMSNGAKWYCADVFGGPVYTPDELGALVDGESGEMVSRPPDEVITIGNGATSGPVGAASSPVHSQPAEAVDTTPQDSSQPTFDEAMQAERGRLISEILDRKREINLSDKDYQDYKVKRLGKGTYQTCDLAALRDLRGDLYNAR